MTISMNFPISKLIQTTYDSPEKRGHLAIWGRRSGKDFSGQPVMFGIMSTANTSETKCLIELGSDRLGNVVAANEDVGAPMVDADNLFEIYVDGVAPRRGSPAMVAGGVVKFVVGDIVFGTPAHSSTVPAGLFLHVGFYNEGFEPTRGGFVHLDGPSKGQWVREISVLTVVGKCSVRQIGDDSTRTPLGG